jgi:hypothetical protein
LAQTALVVSVKSKVRVAAQVALVATAVEVDSFNGLSRLGFAIFRG